MSRVCLKDTVMPSHYVISLNVEENMFQGLVHMFLKAMQSISFFEFNSSGLSLIDLYISKGEKRINCTYKEEREGFTKVYLDTEVLGEFVLVVDYESSYGKLDGFYKSTYNGDSLFTTQFEPTDARKAFPCFDQPDMKATFSLEIKCPSDFIALGNGRLESVTESEGKKIFKFEKTPKMSTYIVAWAVGKLDFIERKDESVVVRLYAHKDELEWGHFALDIAYDCLKFFEEYFGIKYPLPKVDLLSIPSFSSGAMENWGLITFRKTALLWNPQTSFVRSKKGIANTVCHELAHMWFGNLVTMKWWNDLWLNEGFATWAASLALSNLKQIDWNEPANFASSDIEGGLLADCLESTHKISVEVNDPNEIEQIFDAISYDKGSSVIKMLENWTGKAFQAGLKDYLKFNSYSNSETVDLWESLNNAYEGEISIQELMGSWINRPGYPFITVEESGNKLILTQQRFTKGFSTEEQIWPIPLQIRWFGQEEEVEKILMNKKTIEIPMKTKFYKLNDNMSSFIRVKYPQPVMKRIMSLNLSKVDLFNIVSDACEMAFSLRAEFPFDLLRSFVNEDNFEVLEIVLANIGALKSTFYDIPQIYSYFVKMQNDLISHRLQKIDLLNPSTDVNDLAIESMIVSVGVSNEIYKVEQENVHREFKRSYFATLSNTNISYLKEFYVSSKLPGVKESALSAMGRTRNQQFFEEILKDISFIKPHDMHYFASSFGGNYKFRHIFATFIMENFEKIEKFVEDDGMLRSVIKSAFSEIHQEDQREKVLAFLEKLEAREGSKGYTRAISEVRAHLTASQLLRSKMMASFLKMTKI
ncbi:hypothetical protein NUSPORA_00324 [Nucleospora cyclopteri]